jgi:hypothetical protein
MATAISYIPPDTRHLVSQNILKLPHTIWKELATLKGRKVYLTWTYLHARLQ